MAAGPPPPGAAALYLQPAPLPVPLFDRAQTGCDIALQDGDKTTVETADLVKDNRKVAYMFRERTERHHVLHSGRGEVHIADKLVRTDTPLHMGLPVFQRSGETRAIKKLRRKAAPGADKPLFDDHLEAGRQFADNPYSEVSILKQFGNDEDLLQCHEALRDDEFLYIITTYVAEGDLFSHIIQSPDPLPYPGKIRVARRLVQNLRYMETKRLVHRDLKPENTLVNGKFYPFFDCAQTLRRQENSALLQVHRHCCGGSRGYLAPERWYGLPFNEKSDVFAFGCILFRLLTGVWLMESHQATTNRYYDFFVIRRGLTNEALCAETRLRLPGHDSLRLMIERVQLSLTDKPLARDLLQRTLDRDPDQRPTAEEILQDDFFALPSFVL